MSLQDPHGIKVDCLCDNTGYVYNAMVSSQDPLKYDELRGRVVAVCYALLMSENLHGEGKSYMNENQIVQFLCYHCTIFQCHITKLPLHDRYSRISIIPLCPLWKACCTMAHTGWEPSHPTTGPMSQKRSWKGHRGETNYPGHTLYGCTLPTVRHAAFCEAIFHTTNFCRNLKPSPPPKTTHAHYRRATLCVIYNAVFPQLRVHGNVHLEGCTGGFNSLLSPFHHKKPLCWQQVHCHQKGYNGIHLLYNHKIQVTPSYFFLGEETRWYVVHGFVLSTPIDRLLREIYGRCGSTVSHNDNESLNCMFSL